MAVNKGEGVARGHTAACRCVASVGFANQVKGPIKTREHHASIMPQQNASFPNTID
jgi:hypothetical protein